MCRLKRRQVEMRDYLRIAQGEWAAGRDVNITEDAHVLIRRHRVPVDPRPAQIIGLLWKNLDGQGIELASAGCIADVQLMHAERAGDLIRGGNLLAVEPDVGAKIHAIEVQPD